MNCSARTGANAPEDVLGVSLCFEELGEDTGIKKSLCTGA